MSAKPAAIPLFGDAYMADTRHLSLEEHGAYLMLMMVAWRTDDCALPDDDKRLARMLGIGAAKWAKLKPSIMAFWTLENGQWRQSRLTKERTFVDEKRATNSSSAKARWDKQVPENKQGEECERISERNAPPPSPPQASKGEEAKASPPSARAKKTDMFPRPLWADPEVWDDWMVVRKAKGGRNTATAYAGFLADVAKLTNDEWPPGRLLAHAVSKSWAGIYEPKEDYPSGRSGQQRNGFSSQGSTRDLGMEVARELAEQRTGGGVVDIVPRLGAPGRTYG